MTLTHILVFSLFALVVGQILVPRWRGWFIFMGSLAAAFWLQPSTPIRHLDFWLPLASITLTVFVWAITRLPATEQRHRTYLGFGVVLATVLVIGLTRYIDPFCCLTPSPPPGFLNLLLSLVLAGMLIAIPYRLLPQKQSLSATAMLLILALFIILKTELLARAASAGLRASTGQSSSLASAADLPWLGFSYLAFRLLHVLRDHHSGKLPPFSLAEFINYALFFPTLTAGPIDRSQRFIADLRNATDAEKSKRSSADLYAGGERILFGVFKKFVLADSLAIVALNSQNASQVTSSLWMWLLIYAYALRIYFDFSGYTDVAIGLGKLLGFNLPENFERPYWKQNLTAFWNSWHMTLAQWFRAYYFNPVTRALRTRPHRIPTWGVILLGQFTTMLLIGLWHGFTWNFALWGAWHGLGLFVYNRWSEWTRPRLQSLGERPNLSRLVKISSWLLTFHYITLGWVWFALPNPASSWNVFHKLFGF